MKRILFVLLLGACHAEGGFNNAREYARHTGISSNCYPMKELDNGDDVAICGSTGKAEDPWGGEWYCRCGDNGKWCGCSALGPAVKVEVIK